MVHKSPNRAYPLTRHETIHRDLLRGVRGQRAGSGLIMSLIATPRVSLAMDCVVRVRARPEELSGGFMS
jgi:hypothetical protein